MEKINVRFEDNVMRRVKNIASMSDRTASDIAREAMDIGLDIAFDSEIIRLIEKSEGDAKDQLDLLK